jgi:hypothetical protein
MEKNKLQNYERPKQFIEALKRCLPQGFIKTQPKAEGTILLKSEKSGGYLETIQGKTYFRTSKNIIGEVSNYQIFSIDLDLTPIFKELLDDSKFIETHVKSGTYLMKIEGDKIVGAFKYKLISEEKQRKLQEYESREKISILDQKTVEKLYKLYFDLVDSERDKSILNSHLLRSEINKILDEVFLENKIPSKEWTERRKRMQIQSLKFLNLIWECKENDVWENELVDTREVHRPELSGILAGELI